MLIPQNIRAVLIRPSFWSDYFWAPESDTEYPEFGRYRFVFPVPSGHALVLRLSPQMWEVNLGLLVPGKKKPIELGWDDQTGFHPHVLRWEELDALCRCIARRAPTLPHPGLPLLLLFRFAPLTKDDDRARAQRQLKQAWARSGFRPPQGRKLLQSGVLLNGRGVHWKQLDGSGWVLEQKGHEDCPEDFYSLRTSLNRRFPHADLDALFDSARASLKRRAKRPAARPRPTEKRAPQKRG